MFVDVIYLFQDKIISHQCNEQKIEKRTSLLIKINILYRNQLDQVQSNDDVDFVWNIEVKQDDQLHPSLSKPNEKNEKYYTENKLSWIIT